MLNIQAVKDFVEKLMQEENVQDIKESAELILAAKNKVFAVICRLFEWDEYLATDTRSGPDPIVEQALAHIAAHPDEFTM